MIPPSDHFDGKRFFNPTGANGRPFREVPRMLRTERTPWPRHVDVVQRKPPQRAGDETVITFIGHSTFLIQTPNGCFLTDPVYSQRASPFGLPGPKRVRAPGVALDDLPHIDTVLLSHNHYDHCDVRALRTIARKHSAHFITPLGNGQLLKRAGATRIEELDWWETSREYAVTLTPAQHFSARTPWDRNRALWSGFVINTGKGRVYFAGDTGYMPFFREIAQRAGPIDTAIIPIGAYEPRWFMKDIHMNPEEAVQAHVDVGARMSIACHFGTFQLTAEGIDAPAIALRESLRARGIRESDFIVPDFGESIRV